MSKNTEVCKVGTSKSVYIEGSRAPLSNTVKYWRKKFVNNAKVPYGTGTCYFNFFLQGDTGTIQAYMFPFGHRTRTEIERARYWTKVFLMFYSQYFFVNFDIQKWTIYYVTLLCYYVKIQDGIIRELAYVLSVISVVTVIFIFFKVNPSSIVIENLWYCNLL
jgi:hypothetical protein